MDSTNGATLTDIVHERTKPETLVYADDAPAFNGVKCQHQRTI